MGQGVGQGRQRGRLAEADASEGIPGVAEKVGGERTFAWICHNRGMAKDYERLCATGEAFVYAAMTRLMVRRLAGA